MIRTQIYLTEDEKAAIGVLAGVTGKAQSEIIREAIDHFVTQKSPARRKAIIANAAGMWKDRQDLPDFDELRKEWDRDLPL